MEKGQTGEKEKARKRREEKLGRGTIKGRFDVTKKLKMEEEWEEVQDE